MSGFSMEQMQKMQRELQECYKDQWESISPETGKNKVLWMMGEVGEVIDVIKKDGSGRIMGDAAVRGHFVEEMADVLMYFNDVMLCYGIGADELEQAYRAKFERNMKRW